MECLKICVCDHVGVRKEKKEKIVTPYIQVEYKSALFEQDSFVVPTACSPPMGLLRIVFLMAQQMSVESLCF